MALGMLFAMTLPGLVVVLVVLAGVEVALSRRGRRGLFSGSARPSVSASGLDVFATAIMPGKANELEQRRVEQLVVEEDGDGAPPDDAPVS